MNYAIEIKELDASDAQAQQQDSESIEEFHARIDAARGNAFFVLTILDANEKVPQARQLYSPYFSKDSDEARFSVLSQAMKKAKTAIVDRERKKPKATALRIVV